MAENRPKIFVDSNVLVALYRLDDSLHQQAVQLAADLDKLKPLYVTNNYCINEALTILLLRTKSLEVSIRLGQLAYEKINPWFKVLQVDKHIQKEAWDLFQQQKPNDQISFADCTIIAQVRDQNITQITSFDRNLQKLTNNNLKIVG